MSGVDRHIKGGITENGREGKRNRDDNANVNGDKGESAKDSSDSTPRRAETYCRQ